MKSNKYYRQIIIVSMFVMAQHWSNAQFSIEIKTDKVSQTIFCQSKYSKKYIIHDTLDVFAMMNFSCIEIKFPNRDWIPSCYPVQDSEDGRYLSTYESGGYINLLPVFYNDTSLISEFGNSGTQIQLRFKLQANVEETGFLSYYSNVDTMYLSPATPGDIAALADLHLSGIPIDKFAWLLQVPVENRNYLELMRSQFPNSIISEIAQYFFIRHEMNAKYFGNNRIWSTEIKNQAKYDFSQLLQSKSMMVSDNAKFEIEIGVDARR